MNNIASRQGRTYYQCPVCLATRYVQNGIAMPITAAEAQIVETEVKLAVAEAQKPPESSFFGTIAAVAGAVILGAILLDTSSGSDKK